MRNAEVASVINELSAFVRYRVATARRGWAPPSLVLNALPAVDLLRWLEGCGGVYGR